MKSKKQFFAQPQPDGNGHQVSYEKDGSRRVHHFPDSSTSHESAPHGAGSYHDPEQHRRLVERFEAYLRGQS